MSEDNETFAERALREMDEASETMWRNAIADTVLEMLERGVEVTKESLKAEIAARSIDDGKTRIDRAVHIGALKALDGNPPY